MSLLFPTLALRCHRRQLASLTVYPHWPLCHAIRRLSRASDPLPVPPSLSSINSPEDKLAARSWIAEFKKHPIPKRLVEFTFARSSGPGGQNVNKVNTKASLRCSVNVPWIPTWARVELQRSTHYVSSTNEILITSTVHRSQAQNVEECLSQLHVLLVSASSSPIKNDPTEGQKQRVKGLERAEKTARRREKTYRSDVKKGRRQKNWD
ncbi:hypothetical protein AX15_007361 [Amanita polypyramis BW_CC]|nr:hypothetical protein AX15_007361 [Amanita polypyramis BW_CC]